MLWGSDRNGEDRGCSEGDQRMTKKEKQLEYSINKSKNGGSTMMKETQLELKHMSLMTTWKHMYSTRIDVA